MKRFRYIKFGFSLLLSLLLVFSAKAEGFAINSGFSTETLPEDDTKTVLGNIKLTTLTEEPPRKAIECFDVDESGAIAVGCSDFDRKTICVYDGNCAFQYGYSFECSGGFGVELRNDILSVYFVRSDIAVSVNAAGEVEAVEKIENTPENNTYWNEHVFSANRKIGENIYILKNDPGIFNAFSASYSQLIAIDTAGEERVLYDVNSGQLSSGAAMFVAGLVFIAIVAVCLAGMKRSELYIMNKSRDKKCSGKTNRLPLCMLIICVSYGFAGINILASIFFASSSGSPLITAKIMLGIVMLCMVPVSYFDTRKEMRGKFNAAVCFVIYLGLSIWAAKTSSWWLLLLCAVEVAIVTGAYIFAGMKHKGRS